MKNRMLNSKTITMDWQNEIETVGTPIEKIKSELQDRSASADAPPPLTQN